METPQKYWEIPQKYLSPKKRKRLKKKRKPLKNWVLRDFRFFTEIAETPQKKPVFEGFPLFFEAFPR